MRSYNMYECRKFTLYGQEVINIFDTENMCIIPEDEGNTDYQKYLAWISEGNEPEIVEL